MKRMKFITIATLISVCLSTMSMSTMASGKKRKNKRKGHRVETTNNKQSKETQENKNKIEKEDEKEDIYDMEEEKNPKTEIIFEDQLEKIGDMKQKERIYKTEINKNNQSRETQDSKQKLEEDEKEDIYDMEEEKNPRTEINIEDQLEKIGDMKQKERIYKTEINKNNQSRETQDNKQKLEEDEKEDIYDMEEERKPETEINIEDQLEEIGNMKQEEQIPKTEINKEKLGMMGNLKNYIDEEIYNVVKKQIDSKMSGPFFKKIEFIDCKGDDKEKIEKMIENINLIKEQVIKKHKEIVKQIKMPTSYDKKNLGDVKNTSCDFIIKFIKIVNLYCDRIKNYVIEYMNIDHTKIDSQPFKDTLKKCNESLKILINAVDGKIEKINTYINTYKSKKSCKMDEKQHIFTINYLIEKQNETKENLKKWNSEIKELSTSSKKNNSEIKELNKDKKENKKNNSEIKELNKEEKNENKIEEPKKDKKENKDEKNLNKIEEPKKDKKEEKLNLDNEKDKFDEYIKIHFGEEKTYENLENSKDKISQMVKNMVEIKKNIFEKYTNLFKEIQFSDIENEEKLCELKDKIYDIVVAYIKISNLYIRIVELYTKEYKNLENSINKEQKKSYFNNFSSFLDEYVEFKNILFDKLKKAKIYKNNCKCENINKEKQDFYFEIIKYMINKKSEMFDKIIEFDQKNLAYLKSGKIEKNLNKIEEPKKEEKENKEEKNLNKIEESKKEEKENKEEKNLNKIEEPKKDKKENKENENKIEEPKKEKNENKIKEPKKEGKENKEEKNKNKIEEPKKDKKENKEEKNLNKIEESKKEEKEKNKNKIEESKKDKKENKKEKNLNKIEEPKKEEKENKEEKNLNKIKESKKDKKENKEGKEKNKNKIEESKKEEKENKKEKNLSKIKEPKKDKKENKEEKEKNKNKIEEPKKEELTVDENFKNQFFNDVDMSLNEAKQLVDLSETNDAYQMLSKACENVHKIGNDIIGAYEKYFKNFKILISYDGNNLAYVKKKAYDIITNFIKIFKLCTDKIKNYFILYNEVETFENSNIETTIYSETEKNNINIQKSNLLEAITECANRFNNLTCTVDSRIKTIKDYVEKYKSTKNLKKEEKQNIADINYLIKKRNENKEDLKEFNDEIKKIWNLLQDRINKIEEPKNEIEEPKNEIKIPEKYMKEVENFKKKFDEDLNKQLLVENQNIDLKENDIIDKIIKDLNKFIKEDLDEIINRTKKEAFLTLDINLNGINEVKEYANEIILNFAKSFALYKNKIEKYIEISQNENLFKNISEEKKNLFYSMLNICLEKAKILEGNIGNRIDETIGFITDCEEEEETPDGEEETPGSDRKEEMIKYIIFIKYMLEKNEKTLKDISEFTKNITEKMPKEIKNVSVLNIDNINTSEVSTTETLEFEEKLENKKYNFDEKTIKVYSIEDEDSKSENSEKKSININKNQTIEKKIPKEIKNLSVSNINSINIDKTPTKEILELEEKFENKDFDEKNIKADSIEDEDSESENFEKNSININKNQTIETKISEEDSININKNQIIETKIPEEKNSIYVGGNKIKKQNKKNSINIDENIENYDKNLKAKFDKEIAIPIDKKQCLSGMKTVEEIEVVYVKEPDKEPLREVISKDVEDNIAWITIKSITEIINEINQILSLKKEEFRTKKIDNLENGSKIFGEIIIDFIRTAKMFCEDMRRNIFHYHGIKEEIVKWQNSVVSSGGGSAKTHIANMVAAYEIRKNNYSEAVKNCIGELDNLIKTVKEKVSSVQKLLKDSKNDLDKTNLNLQLINYSIEKFYETLKDIEKWKKEIAFEQRYQNVMLGCMRMWNNSYPRSDEFIEKFPEDLYLGYEYVEQRLSEYLGKGYKDPVNKADKVYTIAKLKNM